MILGKWPTWRTILFYVFIFIFNSLHISSTSCSSSGETNCVNTTSGSCWWPCRAHRQLPEVVLTQFVSPDDEHDVLETCRELKIKINTQKRIVRHVGHLPRIIISFVFYPEQQTGFWQLVMFVVSDTKVWRLLSTEIDPISGTFCSVQNIRQWTKFRNPVIWNVIHDCWIPLEVTA